MADGTSNQAAAHASGMQAWKHHTLMFGAYFFGSRRFSKDLSDGFDASNAQDYHSGDRKEFLKKNFHRAVPVRVRQPRAEAQAQQLEANQEDAEQPSAEQTDVADEFIEIMEGTDQFTPRFVLAQFCLCMLLFIIFAIGKGATSGGVSLNVRAGLDTLHEGTSDLRLSGEHCEDQRFQIWRWITYQWTHSNVAHLLYNMIVLLVLGSPLEGHEGSYRTAVLFNAGVIGGALSYIVNDAHSYVVGCSGGIYALLGMHIADLALNWKEKKFRAATAFVLGFIVLADLVIFIVGATTKLEISYSCNLGGLITGLIGGVLVGKNLNVLVQEVALKRFCQFFGGLLMLLCFIWLCENRAPRNVWEAMRGEAGYCWTGQFFNASVNATRWSCFRCASQECIDGFMQQEDYVLGADSKVCRQLGWFFYEY